ncbi:MAG: proline racemase family protein [Alphaproteobacteria bacterium]|nr:proline racemase family protein [Alphaproteobacteria bacterium]
MSDAATYRVIDMHTAGEPVRIVVEGYPALAGATILDKRRQARERHDVIRQRLMLEPRGHAEMYGVIPVAPSAPGADLAVLFCHHEGYSTMCGHATIAMGRFAVDRGLVPVTRPVTRFGLECPCGVVQVSVAIGADGRPGEVSFDSVPAFVLARDAELDVPGFGRVRFDIGYGGAFYAILPASRIGVPLRDAPIEAPLAAGRAITDAIRAAITIAHPTEPDLGFLYGTILTDDVAPASGAPSANICVFGDGQIDRSPTGSGVTARLAVEHARGRVRPGQRCLFTGATGLPFSGEIVATGRLAALDTITARVGGRAHYSGESVFRVEPDDPLADGFLVDRFRAPA